jgi:hypothetical protein
MKALALFSKIGVRLEILYGIVSLRHCDERASSRREHRGIGCIGKSYALPDKTIFSEARPVR